MFDMMMMMISPMEIACLDRRPAIFKHDVDDDDNNGDDDDGGDDGGGDDGDDDDVI